MTDHVADAVAALSCHHTYIESLGDPAFSPDSFLRNSCQQAGETLDVPFGVAFELIPV